MNPIEEDLKHHEHPLVEEIRRIENVMTSGEVMRFHAVPSVTTKQTVAQHAWGVATLFTFIKTDPRPDAIMACLVHDMHELITGDVPFTAKREIEGLSKLLDMAEHHAEDHHLFNLPRLTKGERHVLKLADMLEGLRWTAFNERPPYLVHKRWASAIADMLDRLDVRDSLDEGELNRIESLFNSFLDITRGETETPDLHGQADHS